MPIILFYILIKKIQKWFYWIDSEFKNLSEIYLLLSVKKTVDELNKKEKIMAQRVNSIFNETEPEIKKGWEKIKMSIYTFFLDISLHFFAMCSNLGT